MARPARSAARSHELARRLYPQRQAHREARDRRAAAISTASARLKTLTALRMLKPCAAVISCAGLFVEHGGACRAAGRSPPARILRHDRLRAAAGAPSSMTTPEAERAGIALLTAMGFDYAPGDIAALVAEDRLWTRSSSPTRCAPGTARTREVRDRHASADVEWRDGALCPHPRASGVAASSLISRGRRRQRRSTPAASRSRHCATSRPATCASMPTAAT